MKAILLFFILFNLSISQNEYYNIERIGRKGGCTPYDLVNDIMTSSKPTVSDCVDRELEKGNYGRGLYDKCCYVRLMVNGRVGEACIGLDRQYTMDVPGYIPIAEKQLKRRISQNTAITERFDIELTEGTDIKIYSVDCDASYIKLFAYIFVLFGLLL